MCETRNWIKLNRGIWDNFIWDFMKPKYALAWIDMLLMANYKDKKILFDGKAEVVERGTFITSMVKLSERWGMDRATVKRFLDTLQDDGMITYECNNRRTVINIVNYNVYQSFYDEDATAESTAESATDSTTESATESTTDSTQHKKVKNVKKVKKVKKERNNINISDEGESSDQASPKPKPVKHKYGEYQHVLLSDKEFEKLGKDYGADLRDDAITFLDEYIEEKGYKSHSHNLAIRRWVVGAVQEKRTKYGQRKKQSNIDPSLDDLDGIF